ncbi:hypothetical protein TSUD_215530 [Trifolium subterraneum]|uniref:Protein kinase domain-containing protein n=1 Tax=Trifolium subterraneum TaxID=3900 RepID=A0A2Z6MRL7_TRISU|nr:hypothetical protein TSUD_215530 [Trifolium subterraneum]
MFNVSIFTSDYVPNINLLRLKWLAPNCKDCESKGKICSWKNSTTNTNKEVYCFVKNKQGNLSYNFKFVNAGSILEIKRITNNFGEKLGEGAYGNVYKGCISKEFSVAVKILNVAEGNGQEFLNEVGTMGRIHHVNIVRLIGFCADGFKRALIYEFLPNDSLQKFINSRENKNNFLGWKKLQEIALGIAKGIEYLHQDVYSYGMMLLETIGGRKIMEDFDENSSHVYYSEWIYNLIDDQEEMRIHVDDEEDEKIARKMAIVGLWCIQWHAMDRPSMQMVVQMLGGDVEKIPIPSNPFASQSRPPKRNGATATTRQLTQDLDVIQELDDLPLLNLC